MVGLWFRLRVNGCCSRSRHLDMVDQKSVTRSRPFAPGRMERSSFAIVSTIPISRGIGTDQYLWSISLDNSIHLCSRADIHHAPKTILLLQNHRKNSLQTKLHSRPINIPHENPLHLLPHPIALILLVHHHPDNYAHRLP